MLFWDKKYMKKINPSNDLKLLIEKLKVVKKNNDEEIIDEIENDYYNKINEILKIENNKKELSKILNLNSLDLLKEEYKLVKLFSKYSLQQNNYDISFLLKILNLLLDISEELRKRINQPEIIRKIKNDKQIVRCSYKFCNFRSECNYHYHNKKCNMDHFVHNMVSTDLKNLIKFFKGIKGNAFISNKDVIKSINTILFVISHMESELSNSCRYESNENWSKYHI